MFSALKQTTTILKEKKKMSFTKYTKKIAQMKIHLCYKKKKLN